MSLVIADRVKETTTTTGTGALSLGGAVTGFRSFGSVCATNDTCYYCLQAVDGSGTPTGDWEVGLGTYSATNTLTRTTVLSSSNSNAAVNLASGAKQVWIDLSAAEYTATRNTAYAAAAGSTPVFSLVSSGTQATFGPSNPLILTGLDTANYDYRVTVRLSRGSGGASLDYLRCQFGDTGGTPTWLTDGAFMSVTGAATGNLTTSSGVTRVAQVQNNSTLNMGATLDLSFTNSLPCIVSGFTKSYFWENSTVFDSTLSSRCGALKFTTEQQNWSAEYTLWALRRN